MSQRKEWLRTLLTKPRRPRLHEQLEDRILFDAVPGAAIDLFDVVDHSAFVPSIDGTAEPLTNAATVAQQAPAHDRSEIVFVDKSVEGYGVLVADLVITNSAEVVFLDQQADGLSQISDLLRDRSDLTAIHIISHGDRGELTLGTATLTASSMANEHADELAIIRAAMSENADLLIYGCRFGEGEIGRAAAATLANATGADVAASDDLTGNLELGGDWDLELRTGSVETTVLSASHYKGVLSVEATESIVTVLDAETSNAGTVSLIQNGSPLAVTTSGTPFRVGQMLERVWQFGETGDVGEATYVFDISGIADINGTRASEFGLIISDAADLSGTNTTTLVASGYDATNHLIYFHGVDLDAGDYFGLATKVVADNFSVFPTASGLEDTAIDLGLALNPALTDGGTLQDIIATAIGYRANNAGTTPTEFLIPAGTTGIKITGYSTLNTGTSAADDQNDDYQSLNVSINLEAQTSNGFLAYLIDQGPERSDQFGWSDAPLGSGILTGGGTLTGDHNDNINPTFSIVDGKLRIVENHNLQTAYHVEFQTNATSSAEFIQTASAVREDGDQSNVTLAIPANADFVILNIADAATAPDSQVEYKGNSRIYIDLSTLLASGAVAAQRGETDNRVINYAFENYDVSSATVGPVIASGATVIGDTQQTQGLPNDSQIYVSGGNLIIDRNNTFASNFNSLITVEYYERKDVGSSAELLGESTDYGLWNADPSDPISRLSFDIPANATLGILNLSMNGTNSSDTNENMGAGFAVIDLTTGKSSGTIYMVRTSNIVDFVAWDSTDFGTVFFEDPTAISNHSKINQFNDKFAGNAEFKLNAAGDKLILETHSNDGTQSYRDYFAGGQIQWYGSAPFELSGFPVGGTFSSGSLNTVTGNWDLTIEDALANGLFFIPDDHVSGTQPIDVSIRIGDEVDITVVRLEAVIDPVSFDAADASGNEDTDIAISANVNPTFVDQDGSETLTSIGLRNITIGHTISDGTNSFTATAGNQDLDITGWNRSALSYRALPNQSGTFSVDLDIDWQDVGGGVTDTDSTSTTFNVIVAPVNDPPVAVDDNYLTFHNTSLTTTLANGVLTNDSDPEGDGLTVSTTPVTAPAHGSVILNSNGTFTYTPTTGYIGTDSFDYQVSDGNGGVATATAEIKVSPLVTGPLLAKDDSIVTDEELTVNVDVMDNDDLPTSGSYSITSTTSPAHGSVTVLSNGTINYTPNTNFFGTDTFDYTLTDASGRTSTATVTVTVDNVQDPPTASPNSASTPEDTTKSNINILANDSDPDGDMLTVTSATAPNGTVLINGDGTIDYTPAANFTGTDTVTYTISDGNGGTATSTVLINVVPVADPPTSADKAVTVSEDGEYVFKIADFAFTDGDPGDTLVTIRIDSAVTDGRLLFAGVPATVGQVISRADIAAGKLAFRPDVNEFGSHYATFDFSVSDGALFQVSPNTITVHVTNLPDPPMATDSAIIVAEDSTNTPLGLSAPTDSDGDTLTVTVTGLPTMGTVTLANGVPVHNGQVLTIAELTSLQYDAPANYVGGDAGDFTYSVSDGTSSDGGVVDITVTAGNDPPVIDLNGPTAAPSPGKVTINDRAGFEASLTGAHESSIIDDAGAFAADPIAGTVASVTRTGVIAGEAFSYTVYDNDISNAATGSLTPGSAGGDIDDLDNINIETPASQSGAVGNGSWGVDSAGGATSTRNGFLFDFTTTPGGSGIGHFAGEFHDLESNLSTTPAEYRVYKAGVLVDSGTIDWGSANHGNGESHFFGYAVCSEADFFDQILIIVGDDGAGGGGAEQLAGDRFTFGTAFVYDADVDFADTFTEGEGAVSIADVAATVSDIDDTTLPSLKIDVDESTIVDAGSEFLVIGGTNIQLDAVADSTTTATIGGVSYDVLFTASTAALQIVRTDATEMTIAETQTVLRDVQYLNTSVLPTEADRVFSVSTTDGDAESNVAVSTITVVRSSESAVWSITGDSDVIDGNAAAYVLNLSAALRDGESASVDINLWHADTDNADFAGFAADIFAAIAAYSGPGTLVFSGGTLTFTSDGTGPMAALAIVVSTTPDGVYEGDEDFKIRLSNPGSTTGEIITVGSNEEVVTTIEDNDSPITVSISNGSATEGSPAEFTISMDYSSFEDIVLDLTVTGGSATAGADFETTNFEYFDGTNWQAATNGTEVTIPIGQTSLLVRVDSVSEGIVEANETFTLSATVLSGSVNDASDTGTGTIFNDDIPAISINDVIIDEDNGTITFSVSLDQAPINAPATVDWATSNGTATAQDYTSASGSLSFGIGEQTKTISVSITDDNLFEQSETLNIDLTNAGNATIADNRGIGTIIDDGTGPNGTDDDRPALSVSDVTATEDLDSHAVFNITLSNPSSQATVVSLSLADVTANSGSDYGATLEYFDGAAWQVLSGNLTIAANTTTVQVRTAIIDDAIIDSNETFTLVATTVSGVTTNVSDTGIGKILDDPTPDDTTVEISGPPSVTEGSAASYTVTIDNTPLTDVTVTFTYSGTASGGTDYSGVASVAIAAGSTSATFSISTIDDLLGEPLENLTVTIQSITGGSLESTIISATDQSVTTNIIDDDIPAVSVSNVTVTEGFNPYAEFTVELSNATFEDINISLSAVGSGADPATGEDSGAMLYDFGTLLANDIEVFDGTHWNPLAATTIAAGQTSVRLRTAINDDAFLEGAETFTVTATVTGGNTTNATASGVGTILDDPTDPEVVYLSLTGPGSVVEGSTTTNYTLTLTEIAAKDVVVTLGYGGTATDGSDYGSVATVKILAGSTSGTFTLPTVDDSIYETVEQIDIAIDSVTGGGFEALSIDPVANAVTTLITDNADTPTVSMNNVTAIEGTDDYAVYTIEITNLSVEDIDFDLTLTAGSAVGGGVDFDGAGGAIEVFDGTNWVPATSATIAAGEFSVQVRVPIVDDTIDEPDEGYLLTAEVTAGTTTNLQVIGNGTILDDDAAPDVTIDDAAASEGDFLVFNVTLSNPSSQPIVLDFAATNLSATSVSDYSSSTMEYTTNGGTSWLTATNGTEVTIPAEVTSIQVRIQTTEDSVLETLETMRLAIVSVLNGDAGNTSDTAVGTINDDDTALVSIAANDANAGEPNSNGQFTVTMTNPSDSVTVISYTITGTADNSTDFSTISGSITLPAGAVSGVIDLTTIDDTLVEGSEDVVLTLTAITSGDAEIAIDGSASSATATITDDDQAAWRLIGHTEVNEGGTATYRLNLLGTLQSGEVASVDVNLIEDSTNGTDHATVLSALTTAVGNYSGPGAVALAGSTITFTSNGTGAMAQLVIALAANNDVIVEGVENYTVAISNAASSTGAAIVIDGSASSVSTTIHDTVDAVGTSDDTARWSITGPTAADEGTTAAYTISLNATLGLGETAMVDVALSDVDTNTADYADFLQAVSAAATSNPHVIFDGISTLTFTAPSDGALMTDLVIDLAIINDVLIEGAESLKLQLLNPTSTTGASVMVDSAAGSVTTTINDTATPGGATDGPAEWSISGSTSVDEGHSASYTISLSGLFGSGETATVDLIQSDIDTNSSDYATLATAITAAVAADTSIEFDAASGRLTYTAPTDGASMADIVVSLATVNDALIEGPEDFRLQLTNAASTTGANVLVRSTASEVTTTIDDTASQGGAADGPGKWSITGDTISDEGGTVRYTVALSGQFGAGEVVTVDLDLSDLTTNSNDYASVVAAITAAVSGNPDVGFDGVNRLTYTSPTDGASMTDVVVDLAITDDATLEASEAFKLALSNPLSSTDAAIAVDSAAASVTTTINDTAGVGGADDGPAEWSLFGQTWADEGGAYPWTIKLSGQFGIGQTATVVIDVANVSTNSSDYANIHAAIDAAIASDPSLSYDHSTNTLTFTAQVDNAVMSDVTINLGITNDAWTEGSESFSIALSSPGSTSGLTTVSVDSTNASVTTLINDTQGEGLVADGPVLWSLSGQTSVDEGASAVYTIGLTGQFGIHEKADVKLTLANIDTNSGDYQAFATAVQDAIAGDSSLSFNAATGVLTFTSPSDGATMDDISVTLAITNDSFTEGPERFRVGLTNAGSTTGALVDLDINSSVATTIDDTNGPNGMVDGPVTWSIAGDTTATEGASAGYTISLSAGLGEGEKASIDVSLSNSTTNSSDYTAILTALQTAVAAHPNVSLSGSTLTYTAPSDGAALSLNFSLPISDDSLIEGNESFSLSLTDPVSTTDANVALHGSQNSVATSIADNDSGEWSVAGSAAVDEGGSATYTISLSGSYGAGETASIGIGLTDMTTAGTDHGAVLAAVQSAIAASSRTDLALVGSVLTFTSSSDGSTMSNLTFSITATQDYIVEANESYTVTLTTPSTTTGIAVTLGTDSVGTVINDDSDTADVTIAATTNGIETGPTAGQFTVSLSAVSSTDTVLNYTVSGTSNSSDHSLVNGSVTIVAGQTSATIAVPVADDSLIEGAETVVVQLTSIAAADPQIHIGSTDTASINIADNDSGEWSIDGSAAVNEGSVADYTISLSGSFGAGETASITMGLTDHSTSAADHAAVLIAVQNAITSNARADLSLAGNVLTFTSPMDGSAMADLVFSITATQDNIVEANENYDVTLGTPASSSGITLTLGRASVNTVINDDADTAEVTIAATTNGDEAGSVGGAFTVSLTEPSSTDTVIAYNVAGTANAADHSLTDGTVTIAAGAMSASIAVPVTDDSLIEGVESVTVSLTSVTSGDPQISIGATDTASINIADNDSGEWSLSGSTTVVEGATAFYTISLSGRYGAGESTSIELGLTDTTTAATDHGALLAAVQTAITASGRTDLVMVGKVLTFTSAADNSAMADLVFGIAATQDGTLEANESYVVNLASPATSTGIGITLGNATVDTVINDDSDTAEVTIAATTNGDEAGTVAGLFTVTMNAPSSTDTVINYTVAGTTNSDDHGLSSGTVTILAGELTAIIAVPVADDGLVEGTESVTVQLSAIASGDDQVTVGATDTASINIADNDAAQWSISGPSNVDEGATALYTISLAGQLQAGEVITVDITLTDIDTNSADYGSLASAVTDAISGRPELSFSGGTLTYTSDGSPLSDILVRLTAIDDSLIEGPEDLQFDLTRSTTSTGVEIDINQTARTVVTTIADTQGSGGSADGPATWSLTGPTEVAEGTSPNYKISLAGNFQAAEVVSVQISLTDTSTNPADHASLIAQIATAVAGNPNLTFNVTTGTLTYIAASDGASMTPLVIMLPISDDAIVETPEDYIIRLSTPATTTGAATGIDAPATEVTTIINGDPHVQDDIQHTTVGTAVSGNVLTNDSDPDSDSLTVTPTPVTPPTNGTLVLASNGSYTYTPNADFRGVDTFEYEVCDDWGNCETAVVTIMLADLSAAKQQTQLLPNGDNFDVTFAIKVQNTGATRMDNLTLFDDVASQFGGTFLSISNVSLDASGITVGNAPTLNTNWSSNTSLDIIDPTVDGEYLLPGEWFKVTYTVTMDPDARGASTSLTNQATVTGADISTIAGNALNVTDASDSGTDPSTTNTSEAGDTGGEDDATPVHVPDLRVAKQQIGTPIQQADGSWNVDFELWVENTGTVDLSSPTLFDDLSAQFSTAWHGTSNVTIDISGVAAGGIAPALNSAWATDPSVNLFDSTGSLKPGEFVRVTYTANVDPDDLPAGVSRGITNQATGGATAIDSHGNSITDASGSPIVVTDLSDVGGDANGTNPNQPGDTGTSDDPTPVVLPEIGIAKRIIDSSPAATGGNFYVTYEAVIRNTGSVDLGQLTLLEDLQTNLGAGFVGAIGTPTIYASNATSDPNFNINWDGNLNHTGDANMFDGDSGWLQPGEQIVVQFTVEVDIDQITPSSHNQMTAGAAYDETPSSSGFEGFVSDLSDTGSDPAGHNPGQTGDTLSTDDPTLIPAIGLAKHHGTPIAAGPNGEDFSVPMTLILKNLGPVELGHLQLIDDVRTQFGGTFVSVDSLSIDTSGVTSGAAPGLNAGWNGNGANLLDGSGTLQSGDIVVVTFNVVIDPDAGGTASALTNSASVTASDANNPGLIVQDLSDSGISPNTTNPGQPGDHLTADDPTPILIGDAGLAKQVTDISRNGIGFDLTIEFTLENTGTAALTNLQLHDDLMAQFGSHFGYVDGDPTIVVSNATSTPTINGGYASDTAQNILVGGELQPGESITVQLVVHVTPAASGTAEIVNQATGGGTPVNPNGSPISGGPVIDISDSGGDPNGTNPGAPGDTGGTSDVTSTSLQFYSYDSFNNFSQGFNDSGQNSWGAEHQILSKQISSLAPEPAFSGSARPGTRIIGRIYNSAGHVIAEEMSLADMGGNWMMVMHNVASGDHHRVEFVELVGQGDAFGAFGDIYGYLGIDGHHNNYGAMEPITSFTEKFTVGSVYRKSPHQSVHDDHRMNHNPLGFGV